jgi:diaminopimelate decarboxylase
MNHFEYRNGILHAEDVPLERLAADVGTPFYCYSTATLVRHYRVFADAFADVDAKVCYGVKANGNMAVIRTLAEAGAGADIVSEGELRLALAAGVPADRIVFSGVGKTRREMALALDAGIYQFNVESARNGAGAGRRHLPVQRGIGAGAGSLERGRHVEGRRGGGRHPGQS